MTTATQQRRSPLGLFSNEVAPRPYDRIVQVLFGHKDVRMMMIDTHILNRGNRGVRSPADALARRSEEHWARAVYHVRVIGRH